MFVIVHSFTHLSKGLSIYVFIIICTMSASQFFVYVEMFIITKIVLLTVLSTRWVEKKTWATHQQMLGSMLHLHGQILSISIECNGDKK